MPHAVPGLAALLLGAALAAPAPAQEADARTAAIVAAAEAFLATLSDEAQGAVLFDWADDAQRANWSNFPTGIYERAGLRWGDLDEPSRAALTALLGTVLSADGLRMVQEQMLADEVLRAEEGGGGGPGNLVFGQDEYYVSFVGSPSDAEPWTLQFGGHHLGVNATVVGPDVTLAPSLTGGQPVRFAWEGEAIDVVVDEVTAADALLASLDPGQRAQAIRAGTRSDLVLGPGEDGRALEPEGLFGADMTAAQRALLLALIEARLGMLNEDDLAAAMAPIEAGLDATALAWFGPEDAAQAYWRVVGPTVILEFAPQEMGGDPGNHLHNIYRNPTNDYGAAWAPR